MMIFEVNQHLSIPFNEIEFSAIRSQGAGGQNVNKVSSAIHLRFDITKSSMPEQYKQRLLELNDKRINKQGQIIIKAQNFRTQEKNRQDALSRLKELLHSVTIEQKIRHATRPRKSVIKKRRDDKIKRGQLKSSRSRIDSKMINS